MATKITTIEFEDGGKTICITETTLNGESMVMGGGWTKKALQIQRDATHRLTRYTKDGTDFWVIDNIIRTTQTTPIFRNIPLEQVKQKLLALYTNNEKIVYVT